MTITENQIIWFPGMYTGRMDSEYNSTVSEFLDDWETVIQRVQKRAEEDGEWAIANEFVGNHEEKMRRMMAFVTDETNIRQALAHVFTEGKATERTIDWLCRDLANASKYMIR